MKPLTPAFLLMLAACLQGQPQAFADTITSTSVGDRELIVTGASGALRALQICESADGGATCDRQLTSGTVSLPDPGAVSGPRIAGVRLLRPDTGANAGVILANSDYTTGGALRIIDAQTFLGDGKTPFLELQLGGFIISDLAAANAIDPATGAEQSSRSVTAFAASYDGVAGRTSLVQLEVTRGPAGELVLPSITGQCTLDAGESAFRIALIPGGAGDIFVAGAGVLRVSRSSLLPSGGPCVVERIGGVPTPDGKSLRTVASLALSPEWYEAADGGTRVHPAGELLMMVLAPAPALEDGSFIPAGVVFANVSDGSIVPVPPFRLDGSEGSPQAMEPISPASTPIDVTFLRAYKPGGSCPAAPCTPLFVGQPAGTPVQMFSLLAAVTSIGNNTSLIDVVHRRFVDANFYAQQSKPFALEPIFSISPALLPPVSGPDAPLLSFASAEPGVPGRDFLGWLQPGVTRDSSWRVVWHAPLPTLLIGPGRVPGAFVTGGDGTVYFDTAYPPTAAQKDPVLHFGAGDNVAFFDYRANGNESAACKSLVAAELATPLHFEARVVAINPDGAHPNRLQLTFPPSFNPSVCLGMQATAELRTGGDKPWLVYDGSTPLQRIGQGEQFVGREPRFDYPYDYTPGTPLLFQIDVPPLQDLDVSVAFTITGGEPSVPGSEFDFALLSSRAPVQVVNAPIAATGVLAYSSPSRGNVLYSAAWTAILESFPATGGVSAFQ